VLTLVSNMFTNVNLTDMETGDKAFRREVLQRFTIERKSVWLRPEITAKNRQVQLPDLRSPGISYHGAPMPRQEINWRTACARSTHREVQPVSLTAHNRNPL